MKIQFVKNLEDCILPNIPDDTYIIYKDGYKIPKIKGIKGIIEFEEFKKVYPNIHANMFIFFGLNRIITPSNRTHFIFEFLFTLSMDIKKISIDYAPFIGEPWRLWFHYGLTNCGNFGVPYSYSIETEWKHWFYRNITDSRFEYNNIGICLTDTYSNLDTLEYKVDFYEVSDIILEWYKEAKKFTFNKYNTPKLIINNLLKLSNKKFNLKYNYESYRTPDLFMDKITPFKLPDLPIYRFIDEENKRRLDTWNKVIEIGKQ